MDEDIMGNFLTFTIILAIPWFKHALWDAFDGRAWPRVNVGEGDNGS